MSWLRSGLAPQSPFLKRLADRVDTLGVFLPRVLAPSPSRFVRRGVTESGGHFLFGPRFDLAKGKYFILLWLDVGADVASPRIVFDAVAWSDDRPVNLVDSTYRLAAGSSRIVLLALRFELAAPRRVEFRAWSDVPVDGLGVLGLHIHRVNEALLEAEANFAWFEPQAHAAKSKKRREIAAFAASDRAQHGSLELWLAFARDYHGSAVLQFKSIHGDTTAVELIDAAGAAQFVLSDERALFHLAFPSQASGQIFGKCQVSATLDGNSLDLGTLTVPALAPIDVTRPARGIFLRAGDGRGTGTGSSMVRFRGWTLDDVADPRPLRVQRPTGERQRGVFALSAGGAVEFAPAQSALFVVETGPDGGALVCSWGSLSRSIDLRSAAPGLKTIAIPDDLETTIGVAAAALRPRRTGSEAKLEIFALGSGSDGASGTEVVVQAIWQDYPLASGALEALKLAGAYEAAPGRIVLWQGSAAFAAGDLPAIQLLRHERGGLAAIRHRGRVTAVDLYAPRRESILVLPTLSEPVLAPENCGDALAGEPVHPALKHLFRRLRPDWLAPQPTHRPPDPDRSP